MMVGRTVILHNHNNATGEITFFQGDGKPIVAAILDKNGNRIKHFAGGEIRDTKAITVNYTILT